RVVVEVRLLDQAFLQRNRTRERRRQAIADARLHLHGDDVRIDRDAAVDRADHALDVHAVLAPRQLDHLRDEGAEGLVHRDAARPVLRQRLAPAGLLGGQLQYPQMAWVLAEQVATQSERVLAGGARDVVEEALGG